MALGAVLAAALTDHSARSKGLYLDGLDVVLEPGTTGNRTGVPIETVRVTEAGPDGVSSMEFTIEDPRLAVTITEGMEVRFHDITRDRPLFTGYVQNFSVRPGFGDQGRSIDVTCQGVEAILDWAKLATDVTFAANYLNSGTNLGRAIQTLVVAATGAGALRVFAALATPSTQAAPIWGGATPGATFTDPLTIPAGTSLREAIRRMGVNRLNIPAAGGGGEVWATVDYTYGLRTWPIWPADVAFAPFLPSDYATLTIDDTPAGAIVAEELRYTVDAGAVVRSVVVRGTGVTATVTDGTGLPGPTAVLDDATVTTTAQAGQAGQAYLASFASGLRGSYRLTDWEPAAGVHAGSPTVMTDARVGLAASASRIAQIEKTFTGSNREDWTVAFGGLPPSGAALIRRLTRDTLS